MLAVLLIISIVSGAIAVGTAQMLTAPLWAALFAYPVGGAFGLLVTAALLSLDAAHPRQPGRFAAISVTAQRRP